MAVRVYGSEIHTITLADMEVQYELTRKAVKNVNLRIDTAGNVKVSASMRVPVDFIESFMRQKQALIITAVRRAEENSRVQQDRKPQTVRQYVDGEQLTLLGDKLEIKVLKSRTEGVSLNDGYLYFKVKDSKDTRHRELMYEKWLKGYRCGVYEKICHQVHEQFQQWGVVYPVVKIRRMTSRWGSCQPYNGVITLNSKLIETPLPCIEYVVMHEFCHFIHPDHSKAFYGLMTQLMPDWRQRKQILSSVTEWN